MGVELPRSPSAASTTIAVAAAATAAVPLGVPARTRGLAAMPRPLRRASDASNGCAGSGSDPGRGCCCGACDGASSFANDATTTDGAGDDDADADAGGARAADTPPGTPLTSRPEAPSAASGRLASPGPAACDSREPLDLPRGRLWAGGSAMGSPAASTGSCAVACASCVCLCVACASLALVSVSMVSRSPHRSASSCGVWPHLKGVSQGCAPWSAWTLVRGP